MWGFFFAGLKLGKPCSVPCVLCLYTVKTTNMLLPQNPSPSHMGIVVVTPCQLAPSVESPRVRSMVSAVSISEFYNLSVLGEST
jgi:hypothetical protein